jgi:hypothetical protein
MAAATATAAVLGTTPAISIITPVSMSGIETITTMSRAITTFTIRATGTITGGNGIWQHKIENQSSAVRRLVICLVRAVPFWTDSA